MKVVCSMVKKNKYKKVKFEKKILKSLKQMIELNQIDYSKMYDSLPSSNICKIKKLDRR